MGLGARPAPKIVELDGAGGGGGSAMASTAGLKTTSMTTASSPPATKVRTGPHSSGTRKLSTPSSDKC